MLRVIRARLPPGSKRSFYRSNGCSFGESFVEAPSVRTVRPFNSRTMSRKRVPFDVEVRRARDAGKNLWKLYCEQYYENFLSYKGTASERYECFKQYWGTIPKRVGSVVGDIPGIPKELANKISLRACGVINVESHMSGVDRTKRKGGYAGSIFFSIKHKMYRDVVSENKEVISYIAQNGNGKKSAMGESEGDVTICEDQSLENPNNAALVRSMEDRLPIRVFSTDHDDDDNKIRYLGLYKIESMVRRRVNSDGGIVRSDEAGFKQYVFTLRCME